MAKKLTEDEMKWILSLDATNVQQEIHKINKANKELIATNKQLKDRMTDLIGSGKKESEEYRNLEAEIKANNKELAANKAKMDALQKTMGITQLTMAQLRKQAGDLRIQLDNTSKALHPEEYARLEKELAKVRDRMGELKTQGKQTQDSLGSVIKKNGAVATFMGNLWMKAIQLCVQALSKIKDFVAEGVKMAAVGQGIDRAFTRIASPSFLSGLQKATKGLVNDFNLKKLTVQADNLNIPIKELGTLLRFAQLRAQETAESVEYLTDSIIKGIGRKSSLILDNLGISVVRINKEVAKTGDYAKAVGNIVREELAKSGEAIDTVSDKTQQRAVLLQNIQYSLGQRVLGIVDTVSTAWNSFLGVIDRWVAIPTVKKLRDEQRETNLLARSIMAAEGRTESRNLLIQEMNKKYPAFLANLNTEKITNEEIAGRLRDVNKEYEERLRLQVMNDKLLSPLQDKKRKLIEEEMKQITWLNHIADTEGKYMSSSFIEAIRSGEVVKMAAKDINRELDKMMSAGSSGWITPGIEKSINKLKKIPGELKEVDKEIEKTTDRINSFGAKKEQKPAVAEEAKSLIKIEEEKLLRAKEMKETTEEELILKNKTIEAIEKEISRLKSLGTAAAEQKRSKADVDDALNDLATQHAGELALLKKQKQETEETEEAYNAKVYALEAAYYEKRIHLLEDFKKHTKDKKQSDEMERQIIDTQSKKLDAEQRSSDLLLTLLKKSRDEQAEVEEESYKAQKTALAKSVVERKITRQQYESQLLTLEASSARTRLDIHKGYQAGVVKLEKLTGSLKEKAIREAGKLVMDADLKAAQARAAQQEKLHDLLKDFKSEFKLTTVGEDVDIQLKVLEDTYRARKEMAEEAGLDTLELDKAYERAKSNIQEEGEEKRYQRRQEYGLNTLQEQFANEQKILAKLREQGLLEEEEYQRALLTKKIESLDAYYNYYKNLVSGAVTALQDAEQSNIDARYDAEISRAQGNSEEIERLEKEKENKKLAVQKKYANVQFAIKVSEIIANTAVAVMQALAQLGPIAGAIAGAMIGVTGAAQVAVANAERKKIMSLTLNGAGSSGGTGARVASGREKGGYIDVIRAQDGKKFNAVADPYKRGFIDKPTVIVGEGPAGKSKEWVAGNDALENPTVAPLINILDEAQRKGNIRTVDMSRMIRCRLAGFEKGGYLSSRPSSSSPPFVAPAPQNVPSGGDTEATKLLISLLTKLDREGIPAFLIQSQVDKEQARQAMARNIAVK